MNISMVVCSLKYLTSNFNLVITLSSWIYSELSISKYDDDKLRKMLNKNDFELAEALIHNSNVLNKILETSLTNICQRIDVSGNDKIMLDVSLFSCAKIFKLLLEYGADAKTNSVALFRKAISTGNTEVVDLLIKHGNDIHYYDDEALRIASSRGYREIVKLLVDAGANVSVNYDEPLRFASRNGYADVVKMLIDAGSRVVGNNNEALTFACFYGHIKTAKILLEAGADPHDNEDYVIKFAQKRYWNKRIIKLLTKK